MKNLLLFSKLMFAFFIVSLSAAENKPTINIIYKFISFGLECDAKILKEEFQNIGYSVRFYKINETKPLKADINIFLQEFNSDYFSQADKNYLIPNPEWFKDLSSLSDFNMILCKTREAERIFKQYHPGTVFIGFTGYDRYDPKIKKNYRQALHVAGKSLQKGTDNVAKAWELNPHLPGLTIYKVTDQQDYPLLNNMRINIGFISNKKLKKIQNSSGLHLCPSETEGFGQYISEALSCGAICITTNAPPMNEFISDQRCLVEYTHSSKQDLATNYYVDPVHLEQVVNNLMLLSDVELEEIGQKNRQFYLKSKSKFQKKIRKIFAIDKLAAAQSKI